MKEKERKLGEELDNIKSKMKQMQQIDPYMIINSAIDVAKLPGDYTLNQTQPLKHPGGNVHNYGGTSEKRNQQGIK